MRLKVTLTSEKNIVLPIHYNHLLQSFIYKNLDAIYSTFLHSQGFTYEKRKFKLFTFSNIFGRRKVLKDRKILIFTPPIHFYISCAKQEILSSHAKTLLLNENLHLGSNNLSIGSIEVIEELIPETEVTLKTLSPVTTHSTDEKGKTIYYNPQQQRFFTLIENNLKKKCNLLGVDVPFLSISPEKGSHFRKAVVIYKNNFIIEGWRGLFRMKAPKEVIEVALLTGIGDRNSQGFGMVAVQKNRPNKRNLKRISG